MPAILLMIIVVWGQLTVPGTTIQTRLAQASMQSSSTPNKKLVDSSKWQWTEFIVVWTLSLWTQVWKKPSCWTVERLPVQVVTRLRAYTFQQYSNGAWPRRCELNGNKTWLHVVDMMIGSIIGVWEPELNYRIKLNGYVWLIAPAQWLQLVLW
jgi:hypothetical protein